jgi:hypothetical protein
VNERNFRGEAGEEQGFFHAESPPPMIAISLPEKKKLPVRGTR